MLNIIINSQKETIHFFSQKQDFFHLIISYNTLFSELTKNGISNRYPPVNWGFYRKGTFWCLFLTAPNGADLNPVVLEILHNV